VCAEPDQTTLVIVIANVVRIDEEMIVFRKKIKSCCCLVYPLRRSSGLKSIHHLMSVGEKEKSDVPFGG
jgi:hypothetical protein